MNADAGPSHLERLRAQALEGEKAGRPRAIRELARLGPNQISMEFADRLDTLTFGDKEATAILELWRDRPYGPTPLRAARWVLAGLGAQADAPAPMTLPRLSKRTETEEMLAVAVPVIARRSDDAEARRALAALSAYPDELVARPASAALVEAPGLEPKVVIPSCVVMLGSGDPALEDRALTLLVRAKDDRATLAILEAAERVAKSHGEAPEHILALEKVTGEKHGAHPAAWRKWWGARGH